MKNILTSKFFYPLCFFCSGIVGGLLGSGGGILAVFALKQLIKEKESDKKTVFATSLAIILPMSAISSVIYSRAAPIDTYSLAHYILPGCIGGITGAILFAKIDFKYLNRLFSLLVIFAGMCMIFK